MKCKTKAGEQKAMLDRKDFMPIHFLKKEMFTGSFQGMRFRMEKRETGEDETRLCVTIWPEPYSYEATPKEEQTEALFSFDESGILKGVEWMNKQWEEQSARWKKALS